MPALKIIFVTITAALALIGAYSILREALLAVFVSREIAIAVILRTPLEEEALDILLDEATRHPCRRRGQRVALVVPRALSDSVLAHADLLERYGVEVWIGDTRENGTRP